MRRKHLPTGPQYLRKFGKTTSDSQLVFTQPRWRWPQLSNWCFPKLLSYVYSGMGCWHRGSKLSLWVNPIFKKPATQPTARRTSLHPRPWPKQRCPVIFSGIPSPNLFPGFHQGTPGCLGRLLAQGIIIGMNNLPSTFWNNSGPFIKCSQYYFSKRWMTLFCVVWVFASIEVMHVNAKNELR